MFGWTKTSFVGHPGSIHQDGLGCFSSRYCRNTSFNQVKRGSSQLLYGLMRSFLFRTYSVVERTLVQSKKSFIIRQNLAVPRTSSSPLSSSAIATDLLKTWSGVTSLVLVIKRIHSSRAFLFNAFECSPSLGETTGILNKAMPFFPRC